MQALPSSPIRSIEFFGIPGSGKTTVACELLRLLRTNGINATFSGDCMGDGKPFARRTLRRLGLVIGEAPRNPGSFLRGARLIARHSKGFGDSLHSIWNFISVQAMANQQLRSRRVMILDQGLVQAIWSARMRENDSGSAADWAILVGDEWLRQCLFVQVDAGVDVAMERLDAREERTSRMQRPERVNELALWSRAEALVAELSGMIDAGLSRNSLTDRRIIIRTDNGTSAHALARMVLDRLVEAGFAATTPADGVPDSKARQAIGIPAETQAFRPSA